MYEFDNLRTDVYFPYARVFAANNQDGVAAVVIHDGNFVILEQYRHSIRRNQYCFPRGFLEKDETPEDGIKRELYEELRIVLSGDIKELGTIIADSGRSKIKTHIFVAEISGYETNIGHEGIIRSVEVPINEVDV